MTVITLPMMPAIWLRSRCATSSTKSSIAASLSPTCSSRAAIAGAVIAGCLVATVQCSSCTITKLTA